MSRLPPVFARIWALALIACMLGWGWMQAGYAQNLQPVPALARVIDQTATLSPSDSAALNNQLVRIEQTRGSQIVVVLVPTTAPEDIAQYSNRLAQSYKIGRKDVGDGLLLVIAKDDKRMRIEVARRLEGAVPDVLAGRIIRETLQPAFKQGQFAQGISSAITQIDTLLAGEGLPAPSASDTVVDGPLETLMTWLVLGFIFLPFLTILFTNFLGRRAAMPLNGAVAGAVGYFALGSWPLAVGFAVTAMALTGLGFFIAAMQKDLAATHPTFRGRNSRMQDHNTWGGGLGGGGFGGGSGGFGGGGFSSGGGGSFGGGGASGSW